MQWFQTEQAMHMLASYYPHWETKKPMFFHAVRTASYLYTHGYKEYLCTAAILHDSIEDTPITKELIEKHFGQHVAGIVVANSKNNNLPKEAILEDIVKRCAQYWEDAMILKMAEVYDNFLFYNREKETGSVIEWEIDRCRYIADLIMQYRKSDWKDPIFMLHSKMRKL